MFYSPCIWGYQVILVYAFFKIPHNKGCFCGCCISCYKFLSNCSGSSISVIINSHGSLRKGFEERYSTLASSNDGFDADPYGTCSLIFYLDFFKQRKILETQCKWTPSAGVSVVGHRTWIQDAKF